MPSSTTSSRRRGWGSSSYSELEETLVVVPLRTASLLFNEHFSTPLQQLRYPVHLDFSHDRFKLRSLSLLSQLKETALQEIDLTGNEMSSLEELNRFASLKSLVAARNLLKTSSSVNLAVHRLTRLDVSDNLLSSVPPLKELPLLQVLNVSHNRIREGWGELTHCAGLQALDASHNQLSWDQESGELRKAMVVLRGLKRLRVLSLEANPVCAQRGYRAWVLANAPKLQVLDGVGVTSAERQGDEAGESAAAAVPRARPGAEASQEGRGARGNVFGATLGALLEREGSTLPALVEDCTRHVQERASRQLTALTADGDPSLVLTLRNAFEKGPEIGSTALRNCVVERTDDDVRAACTVLRSFLLELPQPLVPVELFLPLLEATASSSKPNAATAARLEQLIAPMPPESWLLLEHLMCFLVNASRPHWHDGAFKQLLARVWAPCVLRAPARVMGQFRGRVIDTMASCLLCLLEPRAGDGADEPPSPAAPPSPARPAAQEALLDSLQLLQEEEGMQEETPPIRSRGGQQLDEQLIDFDEGDDDASALDAPTPPPLPPDDGETIDQLRRKQASADELLSALEVLQGDGCSLIGDDASQLSSVAPSLPPALVPPPRPPMASLADLDAPSPAAAARSPARASGSGAAKSPPARGSATGSPVRSAAPPPAAVVPPPAAPAAVPPAAAPARAASPPPQTPPDAPVPAADWRLQVTGDHQPRTARDDAASSSALTTSHRMAMAAAAALEAREAEAARLKQKAQRLLRERSELSCDLEGLQETLTRMERAVARTQEQADALRAESARSSTSDGRRHSAQLATLAKAIGREKQRRLANRNEVGALQRQLTKKRTQREALAARRAKLQEQLNQRHERQTQAEARLEEVKRLEAELRECRATVSTASPDGGTASQLEQQVAAAHRAIAQERQLAASGRANPAQLRREAARERQAELQALLASEQQRTAQATAGAREGGSVWSRAAHTLQAELQRLPVSGARYAGHTELADVREAAKWHAEARAFAAEARRVERAFSKAALQRDAEREGWRDFEAQVAARGSRGRDEGLGSAPDKRLLDARRAVRAAKEEADALLAGEGELRLQLAAVSERERTLRQTLDALL